MQGVTAVSITQRIDQSAAVRAATARMGRQAARITEALHTQGPMLTGQLAHQCAVSNISDTASRANRELERHGFRIVCHLPQPLIVNRFGEPSQQHKWAIERVK